jgi:tRNA nucleotidyltransferase (CCA-adding enzyme)
VIKANCEKSKHLETATIRVHGIFIDLVNLRSEKYSDNSRVPTIEIGTPEEDAFRRDLTINSMFYNINKGEIEDLTK